MMVVVALGMVESLMYLLEQQALGTAGAGAYCAVVFSFVIGAPLLLIPVVMMGLFTSYELTLGQCFKNAIVLIANNLFSIPCVAILSALPLGLCAVNNLLGIIVYIAMALVGTTFMALCWIAVASRGMVKCHNLKADEQKVQIAEQRKAAKQNPYANGSIQGAQKKKAKQAVPFQNPKKKKKK